MDHSKPQIKATYRLSCSNRPMSYYLSLPLLSSQKTLASANLRAVTEGEFNALHYTRVLAEVSGIIYLRKGRYHVKKSAQKQYQALGIQALFKPMLEAAISKYNWGYLDGFEFDIDLQPFWLFMLWRIQNHNSVEQLVEEVMAAFPDLLKPFPTDDDFSLERNLSMLIESRFIERFLQFWGFVTIDPRRYINVDPVARVVQVQPLLKQIFQFTINT